MVVARHRSQGSKARAPDLACCHIAALIGRVDNKGVSSHYSASRPVSFRAERTRIQVSERNRHKSILVATARNTIQHRQEVAAPAPRRSAECGGDIAWNDFSRWGDAEHERYELGYAGGKLSHRLGNVVRAAQRRHCLAGRHQPPEK